MPDLRELYQEVILDHGRKPRNYGKMDDPDRSANGYNPLCGDKVTVYLHVADGRITDVRFDGSGCAICTASASLMTQSAKGRTFAEVASMFDAFHAVVVGESEDVSALGKLAVFAGVREFPMRVKCATLPWHTLHAAVEDKQDTVSTE